MMMHGFADISSVEMVGVDGGQLQPVINYVLTNGPALSTQASRVLQNAAQNQGKSADLLHVAIQANNALRSAVNNGFNAVVSAVGGNEVKAINWVSVKLTGTKVFK